MFLFVVIFAKVYFLERGTMKRFVEDYNEDLHRLPSWIGYFFGQASASDVLADEAEEGLD